MTPGLHDLFGLNLSLCMRKPTICICENKDAGQLCSNSYSAPLFSPLGWYNSSSTYIKVLSSQLYSVIVQLDLCRTWSELQIVGFLTHRLTSFVFNISTTQKAPEINNTYLKARIMGLCGQTWWREPEYPGETTDIGWATTTLPQALVRIEAGPPR